jgi:putative ABC transport system ATP-binding protein
MNKQLLSLRDIGKTYAARGREVVALRDINLSVDRGEAIWLRGASGSGKSTLLMILGGLLRPTTGSYCWQGHELVGRRPGWLATWRRRQVGFVFQSFYLVPYLNVLQNVRLAAAGDSVARRAEELLELLGIAARRAHLPGELSAGERQRVALARALLPEPTCILADEPTGNLDDQSSHLVFQTLHAFHKAQGTVLVVSHDPSCADWTDRTWQLDAGRLRPEHSPHLPAVTFAKESQT